MAGNKLSAIKVESLSEVGRYADGGGLYFDIPSIGSKRWLFRYQLNGKRRWMVISVYHKKTGTLAGARTLAMESRLLVKQGIDPIDARKNKMDDIAQDQIARNEARQEKAVTFEFCAKRYIDNKSSEWKNIKHRQQWENTLTAYVYPFIGSVPIAELKITHVRKCLDTIWHTKTETASRVRQRIEAVISSAIAIGEREDSNPAIWKGLLENFYPKPEKVKKKRNIESGKDGHFPALDYRDMPKFMAELVMLDGIAPLALRFLILTVPRTTELRLAEWPEIDIDKKLWTIPAARMKAGVRHRVALSDAAITLLQEVPNISDYIFSGWKKGSPLSDGGMSSVLKRMGRTGITVHGFRSTFRDFIGEETGFPHRLAEFALAHQLTDEAEKAYARGDMLNKRLAMMNAWALYCDSKLGANNVIAFTKNHHH